jgi:hypothetical protein
MISDSASDISWPWYTCKWRLMSWRGQTVWRIVGGKLQRGQGAWLPRLQDRHGADTGERDEEDV